MGKLEKFISENRKSFDDMTPPANIWENINTLYDEEAKFKKRQKSLRLRTALSLAAMLILVCTAGVLLYKARETRQMDYSLIDPLLAKQQTEYASLVHEKRDALSTMASKDPALYHEFSEVIDKMQLNYKQLKTEMAQSPNKELTLEAMISNLKMQIEVLNQQLDILNYIHQQEKKTPYEHI